MKGDNIIEQGPNTPWYHGPTLMHHLETVEIDEQRMQKQPFRLPVQWVNRPNLDFRGFAGTIAGGVDPARPAHPRAAFRPREHSQADRHRRRRPDLAVANQSITLTLADEVDISRGDVISTIDAPAEVADQFEATVVWMSDQPMLRGRNYLMKIGAKTVTATVAPLKHKINVNTLEHVAADKLDLNEIGVVRPGAGPPDRVRPLRDEPRHRAASS